MSLDGALAVPNNVAAVRIDVAHGVAACGVIAVGCAIGLDATASTDVAATGAKTAEVFGEHGAGDIPGYFTAFGEVGRAV